MGDGSAVGEAVVFLEELIIGSLDGEQSPRPRGEQSQCTGQEPRIGSLPPCDGAKHEADEGERRLHRRTPLVRRFPFCERGAVIQLLARHMLDHQNINRGARKQGGYNESELT